MSCAKALIKQTYLPIARIGKIFSIFWSIFVWQVPQAFGLGSYGQTLSRSLEIDVSAVNQLAISDELPEVKKCVSLNPYAEEARHDTGNANPGLACHGRRNRDSGAGIES